MRGCERERERRGAEGKRRGKESSSGHRADVMEVHHISRSKSRLQVTAKAGKYDLGFLFRATQEESGSGV